MDRSLVESYDEILFLENDLDEYIEEMEGINGIPDDVLDFILS